MSASEEEVTPMDVSKQAEEEWVTGVETVADRCPVDHGASRPGPGRAPAVIPATALPGPRMPAALQIVAYWKRPTSFVQRCRARYGHRFALRIGVPPPKPLYVLTDPEDVKAMFRAPADVLHTGKGSSTIEKFTGQTGLAWLDEDAHHTRRRQLSPTMHGQALKRIEASIGEMAERDVASWPRGVEMPLHPLIHRFTLNVIREVIFGRHPPACAEELLDVLTEMMLFNNRPASTMMIHTMPPRMLGVLKAFRPTGLHHFLTLRERADALIAQAVEERRRSGTDGDDMLAVLLGMTNKGAPLSAVELRDEMMTIFLAGTETTAAAIAWGFDYLTRDPAVLGRLRDELDAGEDDAYLTATVQEVLRLRPSIPQIIPRRVMKPIDIGGVRYEPGMHLWASAFVLHRDPAVYPEPHAFRPERFLDTGPGVYTWIPFGGGRIRCLGSAIAISEMKHVFRQVLTRYELRRADPRPEATKSRSVGTVPAKGTRMTLLDRERVAA